MTLKIEDRALATTQPTARALIVRESLTQEAEQRKLLLEYVKSQMVENLDYGTIPGTDKPTLLKPGAEKLTKLFRTTARFTVEKEIEDWDKGLFYYRFACRIEDADGAVVSEGIGSANSREKRYRWRKAERVCPTCGKAAIKRSKFPPREEPDSPPGWYCFGKIGGCGAQFPHNDDEIINQTEGQIENPDIADCVNSLQKIAKKRALVDAVLGLSLCSDLFTQDLEDTVDPVPATVTVETGKTELPKPIRSALTIDIFAHALEQSTNLIELAAAWNAVPVKFQKALVTLKQDMKIKLAPEPESKPNKDDEERIEQIQRLVRVIAARPPLNFMKTLQTFGTRVMGLNTSIPIGVWPKLDDLTVGQAQQFADLIETNIPIPQSVLDRGDAWEPEEETTTI